MSAEDEIEKAWRDFSSARREPQPKLVSRRIAFTAGYRAAQAAAPRWIAVGERMPEHSQVVLACCSETGAIEVAQFIAGKFETLGDDEPYPASHWVPLPEPPR